MRVCSVDGCDKGAHTKGLCVAHYHRLLRYGDPTIVKQPQLNGKSPLERYEHYVIKRDGCWGWSGSKTPLGYGQMSVNNRPERAHRLGYTFYVGPIPAGKHVLHKCDNPECSNPEHLYVGLDADNTADKMNRGRYVLGRRYKGEAHHNAKLTPDIIRAVRAAEGSLSAIAEEFNLSKTHIADIRQRKTWKHLP